MRLIVLTWRAVVLPVVILAMAMPVEAQSGFTVKQFLELSDQRGEEYVQAYIWGAVAAFQQTGTEVDTCAAADKTAAQILGQLRARAMTVPIYERRRNVNLVLAELLFEGCDFAAVRQGEAR